MSTYTEDHLVERPEIQLMQHELGWDVVNCYDEWNGGVSNQGRDGKREVVLVSRLRPALQRLNPDLPVEAIEGAVEEGLGARRHSHFLLGDRFNFRLEGFHFLVYLESMKTTIDIPDAALADAMRYTGAKTKREAVVKALEEFNRQQRVKDLVASFGTWDMATNDEIEAGDIEEIASGKPKIGIWTVQ